MNRKTKIISTIMALVLTVTLAGCGATQETQTVDESATKVTVYTVGNGNVSDAVSYTGEVKEGDLAGVSSKVNAKVLSVNVDEGSYVNAGAVLATLDSTDLQLTYNQALASYNSAKASYDMTANATTVQSETNAKQALASAEIEYNDSLAAYNRQKSLYDNDTALVSARNALNDAKLNYDRMQQLLDIGSISQVNFDSYKTAYENAKANVDALEANKQTTLETAKTRYENATNKLNSARENLDLTVNVMNEKSTSVSAAGVASAKAALDIAANNLANTHITAPISGYIATKKINKGQMASPGVEIFTIKNTHNVDVEFNVTESVITSVSEGTPAMISVKSAGIDNINGTVTAVNQTKDSATGLYAVKVSVDNSSNLLKIGMFADINLTLKSVNDVIKIPLEAMLQEGETNYVYVVNGDIAVRRDIVVGISDGENTEVTSGLANGEQIVVKGKDYLSEKNNQISITQ